MARILERIIYSNNLQGGVYVEPFAGGAGAGLMLLAGGHVDRVIINDADKAIVAFWRSVMDETEEFIERIRDVPLSISEWERQRAIYRKPGRCRRLDLGFSAFYLNRCNRSGIIMNAGPIGGLKQDGEWKIDARFNRDGLVKRIEDIASYCDRITVLNDDAVALVEKMPDLVKGEKAFVYADPPYYLKGRGLYMSHYHDADHAEFSAAIAGMDKVSWAMTYDDHPRIRELYANHQIIGFNLRYSAHAASTEGGEVLIAPHRVEVSAEVRSELTLLARNLELKN